MDRSKLARSELAREIRETQKVAGISRREDNILFLAMKNGLTLQLTSTGIRLYGDKSDPLIQEGVEIVMKRTEMIAEWIKTLRMETSMGSAPYVMGAYVILGDGLNPE